MASNAPPEPVKKTAKKPANRRSRRTVAAGTIPPSLPPSVEEAYRKKCIELKRRMAEVEQNNDSFRLRKNRLLRGIRKMRLERSLLLHELGKRMRKNGVNGYWDDQSEGSSEGPPTPHDKPLRSKRSHRRPAATPPPLAQQLSGPNIDHHQHHHANFQPAYVPHREFSFSMVPTPNGAPHIAPGHPPQPLFSLNDLYPTQDSQVPFVLSARDYFIQKQYLNNQDPSFEGLTREQLVDVALRTWTSMPIRGIEDWENSYHVELGRWREDMDRRVRETGEAPIGIMRSRRQEDEREMYMRGVYEEEIPEDGGADGEETNAASGGGFTAVNG